MPRIIERRSLLERLRRMLEVGHVLLTAPAGYGKSTALHALTSIRPHTYLLRLTVAERDLTVLRARLRTRQQAEHTVLLDDVHLLEGATESVAWLRQRLEHSRPRWILAGRRLPLDAGLLTVSGRATHLTRQDLAFTPAEAAALLDGNPAAGAGWYERLQGWPLAYSLLARLPAGADRLPAAESHLFEYLAAAVFDQLPPALYRFMQTCAVPLRFNEALARHLWSGEDAPALLAELQKRDLFLQPAGPPGWWRFHDLVRDFLLAHSPLEPGPPARATIAFLRERDDVEGAIEQALVAGFHRPAARLLAEVSDTFLWDHARHLTFHRWIHSLPREIQDAHPHLLVRLAQSLHYLAGRRPEAWEMLRRAEAIFTRRADQAEVRRLREHKAWFHLSEGAYEESLALTMALLEDPACRGVPRVQLLYLNSISLASLGRFEEARRSLLEAQRLAREMDDPRRVAALGEKMALHVDIPRGRFGPARRALESVVPFYAGRPSYQIQYLLIRADLESATGRWEALAGTVEELQAHVSRLEQPENHQLLWIAYNRAQLALARGDAVAAGQALDRMEARLDGDPVARLCATRLRARQRRAGGDPPGARRLLEETLAEEERCGYYHALLGLERDVLATLHPEQADRFEPLHLTTRRLIRWRCRADLVRLRAVLALRCAGRGDTRWRRHAQAVLFARRYAGYPQLLLRRDRALAGAFWRLALTHPPLADAAAAALRALDDPDPVLPLLESDLPAVRARAGRVLAAIGRERAIPSLAAAARREAEDSARQVMRQALEQLENTPPPSLGVTTLGGFALRRGDAVVPPDAWPRPIVQRLFCYFALHRGQSLSRDQLMDDLWPGTPPQKAWNTFRTVFSALRKVLEPYLRSRTPMRYVVVRGEQIAVDPHGVMTVDALAFADTVAGLLEQGESGDAAATAGTLLELLPRYATLLPDLPLEDWLVEPRQRLHDLYVEGALLAAQTLLAQGRHSAAVTWAETAVAEAPWLEAAHQTVMRAHARQGKRTLALRAYETACRQLRRELDIEPSPLTQWLAERLRRGESI